GPLSDVFGRKRILVTSGFVLVLATLACAVAPSFSALLAFRGLQGLAVPGISAVAVAYIGDNFPRARTASLVGMYVAASGLGGLLGRVVAGVLSGYFDWRTAFYAFAVFTLAGTLAMVFALRPDAPGRGSEHRGLFRAYAAMSRHAANVRLLAAFCIGALIFFAFVGVFTYLPYLLSAPPYRLGTEKISLFYLAYLAGVIVSPVSGGLSSRYGVRRLMTTGICIAGVGVLMTLLMHVTLIALGVVVLAIGMFTVQAIAPAFVNITAAGNKGGANAMYQVFYYGGAVFGSTLPGLAWEHWGWHGTLAVCMASLTLALVATFFIDRAGGSAFEHEPVPLRTHLQVGE
ncbi:MAG TPA: MFS transporter, partial [Candidatus Baltobacteraceae bacterium]|nr:MFS transporter [Candidatus Baltobacteraceae bacterium]